MNDHENTPVPTPVSLEDAQEQGSLSRYAYISQFGERDLSEIREQNRIQRIGRVLRSPDTFLAATRLRDIGEACLAATLSAVPKFQYYAGMLSSEPSRQENRNQTDEVK